MLNRILRWTEEGWEYEADQRHGEIPVQYRKKDSTRQMEQKPQEKTRRKKKETKRN